MGDHSIRLAEAIRRLESLRIQVAKLEERIKQVENAQKRIAQR